MLTENPNEVQLFCWPETSDGQVNATINIGPDRAEGFYADGGASGWIEAPDGSTQSWIHYGYNGQFAFDTPELLPRLVKVALFTAVQNRKVRSKW